MADPDKVAAIRALMPATGAGIYLNAGSAGPIPAESQRAMDEQAAHELAVGRASGDQFAMVLERQAELRAAIAAVLVADPDDIAITHSTTDGMNLAINALPWRAGDRAVTTRHEHLGGVGPLLALRERLGIEIEFVDIGDGGDDEATLAAFETALRRPARAVVLSHVLWTTGAVLPIARIGLALSEADPRRDLDSFAEALDDIAATPAPDARAALAPLLLHPDYRSALLALARGGHA